MNKISLVISLFIVVALAACMPVATLPPTATPEPATPTPEIFIPLTQVVPARVRLNGVELAVQAAQLGACDLPDCPPAPAGTRYLRVPLQALNLPADQSLDYKNLPEGIAIRDNTDTRTPFNRLYAYAPAAQQLTLYFAVPEAAQVFGLQWPETGEIPLTVTVSETPTALPPTFEGVEVSFETASLVLPPGLATGLSGEQVPRADGADVPAWGLTPGHTQVTLEGYFLQEKFHQPRFYIYPAQGYANLQTVAAESLQRLKAILVSSVAPISAEQLPAIPFFNAQQVFASNIQVVISQNVLGVRSLTEYGQYPAPANNTDLFYHFQGLTSDGAYYIIAILPITAPGLGENADAARAMPIGGIAYPDMGDANADWQGYYGAAADLLNATAPEAFAPTLTQLDALIQSMRVAP